MDKSSLYNEQQLLQEIAEDNREAFGMLYNNLYSKLYLYLLVVTKSEEQTFDIIQDIFLKLWIKRKTLIAVKSLDNYVFRMAKNRVFDLRKLDKRIISNSDLLDDAGTAENIVDDEVLLAEYHVIAKEAISLLSEKRREIFLLNAQHELSAREISEQLGLTLTSVKKHLYEANHFIRNYLKEKGGIFMAILPFSYFLK